MQNPGRKQEMSHQLFSKSNNCEVRQKYSETRLRIQHDITQRFV